MTDVKWNFPSCNNGQIEGYSNPGHEWFKGNPLQALAREICQNSLDAFGDENKPVEIVFKRELVPTKDFPGTEQLLGILDKCNEFWGPKHMENVDYFIDHARKTLREKSMFVLRVSDFNTIGLQGAYDSQNITPWVSLVKSTGVSMKTDAKGAAGSYGIGKAAAFVNSYLQTVFYRTLDLDGEKAAQGVANLMAFNDDSVSGEDPMRRATGYYGDPSRNLPVEGLDQLDAIYERTEVGTDLFIPGFRSTTAGRADWVELMIGEILENFLMSIYYEKLTVRIEKEIIDKAHLSIAISKNQKSAKNAYCFNKILTADSEDVLEETLEFHRLGTLRLRLLYASDMNKKILVVRKSGMKIADIKGLPRGISFTGILELQGEGLNNFFRKMENPQHNSWDPQRHDNPDLAKEYKREVEDWVKDTICKKLEEASGEESVIDVGDCFNTSAQNDDPGESEKQEKILDTAMSIEILPQTKHKTTTKTLGGSGSSKERGTIDDEGENIGHRHRSGEKGGNPTGRKGKKDPEGKDSVMGGMKATDVIARVINKGAGNNRLVVTSKEDLNYAEIEVVSIGENGKSLPVNIQSVTSGQGSLKNGRIALNNLTAGNKVSVDFTVHGKQNYAMGVRVYGN